MLHKFCPICGENVLTIEQMRENKPCDNCQKKGDSVCSRNIYSRNIYSRGICSHEPIFSIEQIEKLKAHGY